MSYSHLKRELFLKVCQGNFSCIYFQPNIIKSDLTSGFYTRATELKKRFTIYIIYIKQCSGHNYFWVVGCIPNR